MNEMTRYFDDSSSEELRESSKRMSEAERERYYYYKVLVDWNRTSRFYPHDRCLHQLFEEQVERTPNAVAVTSKSKHLTYHELNIQSNQLAHHLRSLGVTAETLVGVAAERSIETLIAILAVLKAGGAYVPIDPGYPQERLRFLLNDSGLKVIISQSHLRDRFPTDGYTFVYQDTDRSQIAQQPETNPVSHTTPGNLAYMIYTSGSTGQPKGVLVPHQQIVHSTTAHAAYNRPAPTAFLLLISFSFDAAGVGIYWTLCTGGRLVIPTEEQIKDPIQLRKLIEQEQITHQDCTPTLYSIILGNDAGQLSSLRCVIVGGEACPTNLISLHYSLLPNTQLVNNYGPTEATVWSTTYDCPPDQNGETSWVPIGRPIPNDRLYILDEDLNPVPIGAPGEIYIGGDGVVRGYHDHPELTATRFIPDPFATSPGERLYKTGDIARYLADGSVDFVGRSDHQVKIRGYRIELEEIEATLLRYHDVAEAAVVVREDTPGDKRLIAYVAAREGATLTRETLIAFLESSIPHYMVPHTFMIMKALPRTVTGKIDRKALPAPNVQTSENGNEYIAPRTSLEQQLAHAFSVILGVERVSINDSFFDLGGNSLLLAQLAMHVWGTYQIDVPILELFVSPTVAGIAHAIEAFKKDGREGLEKKWDYSQLEAECELDPTITPEGLPQANILAPVRIFLTGTTGYLGAFILARLLKQTSAEMYCLVRAVNEDEGLERIRKNLILYQIWDDSFNGRIHAVLGDLARPLIGIEPAYYNELAATIDTIYHSGALVNFTYPYITLKGPNVDGTQEILRLACKDKVKAVHYISTIDVLLQTDVPRPYMENDEIIPLDVPDGYPRSKWVAERLVLKARDRGVPICIYRPGMMMSETHTGATQQNDYLLVQVKGFLPFGIIPEADWFLDAIPVDYAANAITHLSLKPDSINKNFHLWNLHPVMVTEVYNWIRSFGYHIDEIPLSEVLQYIKHVDPSHPLFPLIPILRDGQIGAPAAFEPQVLETVDFRVECTNTLRGIEGSGIECPPMTEKLAHQCLKYMVDVGYFPSPESQNALVATKVAAH
jgi:myxalamid-type nonribosomal peptide synthetase MxaA